VNCLRDKPFRHRRENAENPAQIQVVAARLSLRFYEAQIKKLFGASQKRRYTGGRMNVSQMKKPLTTLLSSKPLVFLDGAMGTELLRRDADISMPLWSARPLITQPPLIQQIHEDYIRAGADIITTNTFRTNRRALQRAGCGQQTESLTHLAVALAQQARLAAAPDRRVLIAGSIAPVEDCYSPELVPTDTELRAEHGEQTRLLAEAGADFLLIETMMSIREARVAAEAARATGLEFVVSFVCSGDGKLLSGESLVEAVRAIEPFAPTMFAINCTSPRDSLIALETLSAATSLPFGVYANTGTPQKDEVAQFRPEVDERGYAECAAQWKQRGARLIGGCCGTTPEHIRAVTSLEFKL
jgi:S-methylmethionine-dependent homocysteine/selenocysteine methylase